MLMWILGYHPLSDSLVLLGVEFTANILAMAYMQ